MKTKLLATRANHLLVLDTGDEVIASLTGFAKKRRIKGGSFSGIGALQQSTIAYWNWDTKEYENIEVAEQAEALTITGNIARSGDKIKIHAHVILGRRDGSAIGGHLLRATVRPTLELLVADHGTPFARRRDKVTRLWLLDLR